MVSGFITRDAEIRQCTTSSVARFSISVSRTEKHEDGDRRISAFLPVESWRKNEHASSFEKLIKGVCITVEGYFKPEMWTDKESVNHYRVVLVTNKFYETPEKEG